MTTQPQAVKAYPLTWPAGVPRTANPSPSQFYRTVEVRTATSTYKRKADLLVLDAYDEVLAELRRIKAVNVVVSTNIPTKGDGTPWGDRKPVGGDGAVAVYWSIKETRGGRPELVPHSIQCDKWTTVADNLHSIALSLDALRGVQRWGAVSQHQVLRAFRALPAGEGGDVVNAAPPERPWREVLEIEVGGWTDKAPPEAVLSFARSQYKTLAARYHPDRVDVVDKAETTRRYLELATAVEAAEAELAPPAPADEPDTGAPA